MGGGVSPKGCPHHRARPPYPDLRGDRLGVLGWLLLRWRAAHVADRLVLGRYLLAAGAIRFAIEFIRINERVLAGLTVAHLVSLALMAAGVVLLLQRPARAAATRARAR